MPEPDDDRADADAERSTSDPAEALRAAMGAAEMPQFTVDPARAWSGSVGFRLFVADDGSLAGELPVTDALRQPGGLVHGGIYACIAEELASVATMRAVAPDRFGLGQSNLTHFLRPVTEGSVHATARALHEGRTSWVWQVEMTDDEGRRCAVSTVTMAVRPRR